MDQTADRNEGDLSDESEPLLPVSGLDIDEMKMSAGKDPCCVLEVDGLARSQLASRLIRDK